MAKNSVVTRKIMAVLPLTLVLVGCNAHQQASAPSPQFSAGQGQQQFAQQAGQQFAQQNNSQFETIQAAYQQPQMRQQMPAAQTANADVSKQMAQLEAFTNEKIDKMGERVRRVERAMIRLDRRMQVIERNELAKVSGLQDDAGNNSMGRFKPTSFNKESSNGSAGGFSQRSPFARGAAILSRTPYGNRGAPVDTQSLSSKNVNIAPLQPAQPQQAQRSNGSKRYASLADQKNDRSADTEVSIWTVNYDPRKIWPDRGELAASSEVVSALRAGKPVSVFARGARPSSKEFRERVRALSRYLGRVSNLESVPIAAMPADHLNTDTIELLVAN